MQREILKSMPQMEANSRPELLTSFKVAYGESMKQGIIGAFLVRVPVSFAMSRWEPVSLFHIGLATPCSTILQITMCGVFMLILRRNKNRI